MLDAELYEECLQSAEEGAEIYRKVIFLAYVLDGYARLDFEENKIRYERNFGEKADLSLPW